VSDRSRIITYPSIVVPGIANVLEHKDPRLHLIWVGSRSYVVLYLIRMNGIVLDRQAIVPRPLWLIVSGPWYLVPL